MRQARFRLPPAFPLFLLLLGAALPASAQFPSLPSAFAVSYPNPRTVAVETWEDENAPGTRILAVSGGLRLEIGPWVLEAEQAVVWWHGEETPEVCGPPAPGRPASSRPRFEFYGERARVRGPACRMEAETLYFDSRSARGKALGIRGAYLRDPVFPLFLRAEIVRLHSRREFTLEQADLSTCDFGEPHYDFSSRRIESELDEKTPSPEGKPRKTPDLELGDTYLYQVTPEAGGVPFFYLPCVPVYPWLRLPYAPEIRSGYSSKFGRYLFTRWPNKLLGRDLRISPLVDYYERRGTGEGVESRYRFEDVAGVYFEGSFKDYHLRDRGEEPRSLPHEDRDRGTVFWKHRHQLPWGYREDLGGHGTRIDVEASHQSDPEYLLEFEKRRYQTDKEQESYLQARHLWENQGLTLLERRRLNLFQTQVEYDPSLKHDLLDQPLSADEENPLSRLYWNSESRLDHLRYRPGKYETETPTFRERALQRADTRQQLSLPFTVGFVHFDTYGGGRATWYSATNNVDWGQDEQAGRQSLFTGAATSASFHDTWGARFAPLQIDRLRHIFTPEIRYDNTYANSVAPAALVPCDEVDQVREDQVLTFRALDRLLTRRGEPPSPGAARPVALFASTDHWINYYHFADRDNPENGHHSFGNLQGRASQNWRSPFNTYGRYEYNYYRGVFKSFTGGGSVSCVTPEEARITLRGEQSVVKNVVSQTALGLNIAFNARWSLDLNSAFLVDAKKETSTKFDHGTSTLVTRTREGFLFRDQTLRLTRTLHQWLLDFSYQRDSNNHDHILSVGFTLRGLAEGVEVAYDSLARGGTFGGE